MLPTMTDNGAAVGEVPPRATAGSEAVNALFSRCSLALPCYQLRFLRVVEAKSRITAPEDAHVFDRL
jgi:hypothetical protein